MKLRRLALAVFPIAAIALHSACGDDDSGSKPTTSPDGSVPADTGTPSPPDSSSTIDSSAPVDSSTPTDAGKDADAAPPPAKLDCRTSGETRSGTYDLDPDGDGPLGSMQLYCDMDWDGGGWTLIESFPENNLGPSSLPPPGTVVGPKPGGLAHLPPAVVQKLAQRATQIHIRYSFAADGGAPDSGTAQWLTSRADGGLAVMENLQRLSGLNRGVDAGSIVSLFEGPSAKDEILGYYDNAPPCTTELIADGGYPSIYHACGNYGGMHIVRELAKIRYNAPTNQPIEIYLR